MSENKVSHGRKQRTSRQNKAMHKYFDMLAEALNESGYDMKKTLKHDVEIPWTREMVKEFLWRPIQEAMTGKQSTTELNTVDPSEIYEVLNRHLSEKTGVSVEWPSEESEIASSRMKSPACGKWEAA